MREIADQRCLFGFFFSFFLILFFSFFFWGGGGVGGRLSVVSSYLHFTRYWIDAFKVILMLYNARSMLAIHSMLKSCTGNKLQAIRPTVGGHQQKSSLSLWDEVVINRFKIGDYAMHRFLSAVRCRPSWLHDLSVPTHCQVHPCWVFWF